MPTSNGSSPPYFSGMSAGWMSVVSVESVSLGVRICSLAAVTGSTQPLTQAQMVAKEDGAPTTLWFRSVQM